MLDGWAPCGQASDSTSFDAPTGAVLRSRVIEIGSGRELIDLGERVVGLGAAVFTPDGRYLAVNLSGPDVEAPNIIELYDITSGELVERFDFDPEGFLPFWLAFDPQGRWLAASTGDGFLWVFDVAAIVGGASAEDAVLLRRAAHQTVVVPPAVNDDGIVATAGFGDGLIRLWDIESGQKVGEIQTATKGFWTVAFEPDGRHLLYAEGNVVRRYPIDNDELIQLARSRLTRELTPEECARYLDPDRCS